MQDKKVFAAKLKVNVRAIEHIKIAYTCHGEIFLFKLPCLPDCPIFRKENRSPIWK